MTFEANESVERSFTLFGGKNNLKEENITDWALIILGKALSEGNIGIEIPWL